MNLLQDLKYAVRLLVKDRWFTAVAAIALALGIGVNSSVFTLVNAVMIRGLPFARQEELIAMGTRDAKQRERPMSYKDFQDIAASSKSFSEAAVYFFSQVNLSDDERAPEQYRALYTATSFMRLLGQRPMVGRDFTPDDDQASSTPSVLISSAIWKNRYGRSPDTIGKVIRVNGLMLTVIGVMPEGFNFPNTDLWIPFAHLAPVFRTESVDNRAARSFDVIARLKPEVSLAQANAEVTTIGRNLQSQYPDSNKDMTPFVIQLNDRFNRGPIKTVFLSLMGAVAFVLLIACANVANLLLARSANRAREISVRIALGATRWRIIRQLLIESVLLSVIAGLFGLGLAVIGIRLFDAATQDAGKPYWMVFSMDPVVFAFFAAVCFATGIIFGLAPALHVSKTDLNDVLKEGGRGNAGGVRARRWTSALIVVELALTLVLLAGAGLMMRSFLALYSMDLGVDTGPLLTMRLNLPARKYPTPEVRRTFLQTLEERLARVPSLQAGAIVTNVPIGGGQTRQIEIDGQQAAANAAQIPSVSLVYVEPRYWETLGTKLLRGRGFDAVDGTPGHENAIINQRFAAMHFGNEDPIGRRVKISIERVPGQPAPTRQPSWVTVIAIAPTIRQRNIEEALPDPVMYLPLLAEAPANIALLVRAPRDAAALTTVLREEVRAIDPDLPLFNIQTMDQVLAQQRWPFRVFGSMFAIFALIALVLAAIGLYAVTAYSVTQRTQEVGVRMALGAQARQVRWLFVRQSLWQLAIGLSIGLAGAFGVGVILKSLLVQTGSRDPVTLTTIVVVLLTVALFASYWPARRATRLDPLKALRYE
jgi:putative ABC transport system permease protein